MSDSLSALIQAVEDAASAMQLAKAVENLAKTRSLEALPILIAALGYNNPGAAVAAVDGLIDLGAAAVPALLDQLDQHNYTARAWAIRALAGIGDPRGLVTLLGVATADFAMSVRRGATRGLGMMQWHWFPDPLRDMAQEEALDALLFVAAQDEEWVVRYAAVVALQNLAVAVHPHHPEWSAQIQAQLERMAVTEAVPGVQARVWWAQAQLPDQLQAQLAEASPAAVGNPAAATPSAASPLSEGDWQSILKKLYERKGQERLVLAEGDPRRYQDLAATYSAPKPA
jgi:phycocyanobilin lyase subunit beta